MQHRDGIKLISQVRELQNVVSMNTTKLDNFEKRIEIKLDRYETKLDQLVKVVNKIQNSPN